MTSCSMTIRFSSILLAAFLAILPPLWAGANDPIGGVGSRAGKPNPSALVVGTTDNSNSFAFPNKEEAGTYQILIMAAPG